MKSTTPSFILELPLKTTSTDESTILTRLDIGRQLYNACLSKCLNRLALIKQSKDYRKTVKLPTTIDNKPNKERTNSFKQIDRKYGFTDYDIQRFVVKIRNSWIKKHISVHIAQKIATRAFKAAQKKAFGITKNVRFKGNNQFDTLEGKDNENGLIFKDNILSWSGLKIPCIIDTNNDLVSYSLNNRVKYCRIVRRKINGRNRFYLQLILEGMPFLNPKNKIGNEEIGLDVGVSTIAIVGDTKAELKPFCNELSIDYKLQHKLQRKLDRSLRATNPNNYNDNGTNKKGCREWTKSNRYNKLTKKLAEINRKITSYRRSLHGRDTNKIIAMGIKIKTEDVSYKAWQKVFGKSINFCAPSMFMCLLKRKAENAGGYILEFSTQKTKLSQTCHKCGVKVKKPLNKRWHECCGIRMQRDLYSAFLAKCVDVNTGVLDIAKARLLWQGMEPVLSVAISRTKQTVIDRRTPASFGFSSIQRQNSSLIKISN